MLVYNGLCMLIFMILMSCGEKVLISPIFHMLVSVPPDNVTEGVTRFVGVVTTQVGPIFDKLKKREERMKGGKQRDCS